MFSARTDVPVPAPMRWRILRVQASALAAWAVLVAWQVLGIAGGELLTDVLADLAVIALWFVMDVGLVPHDAADLCADGAAVTSPCA